jgi:hypothetical protein
VQCFRDLATETEDRAVCERGLHEATLAAPERAFARSKP